MSVKTGEVSGPCDSSTVKDPELSPAQRGKVVNVAYLIAALDATWMFLQFSITPYLAKKLDFDTLWFGYLQSMVGIIQLLGGPLFGRFGDLFGARAALSLACSATVVLFLLLAVTDSPAMLFIHKLPVVFMHVVPACQMVVADLSEPDKRAGALSKMGLCFGIGMIAGSTIGGKLNTRYGETFAASVGAAGSFVSLLLVLKFIPKSTKAVQSSTDGIFQVMFSIIAINFFKLQPEENGYLMAYFGIVQMVIQGGVIGRLTPRYSDMSLLLLSVGVSALTGLAQAYMQNVFHFCFIVLPMMFSLSVFNVITDSILTKSVPSSDTGTMLGLCASVQSLLRTIGPTIGGFLYVNYGVSSFGLIEFVVNVFVFVYLLQRQLKKKAE
ncbi:solute carrier family 22 member 18 isoform X2 [Genypterus blacodes]|uniref:solute carrier family 22 member 18 isoform X2 n=1 Tax=Genypterus blacodes TaxID=154954 RepID=UPI003F75B50A